MVDQAKKQYNVNMTYYRIAKQLKVSDTAVSNWFNGKSLPNGAHLVALSKLLGKDVETILKEFQKLKKENKD